MAKSKEITPPSQTNGPAEAKSEAVLDSEAKHSQVLTLITKRLRAARKKVKKAEETEAVRASGKAINADQEEAIKTKSKNVATIEELERLFPLLKEAVNAEVNEKVAANALEVELKAKETASIEISEQVKALAEANQIEQTKAAALAEDLRLRADAVLADKLAFEQRHNEEKTANEARLLEVQAAGEASTKEAIARILKLFYFSRLFAKEGFANDYVPTTERSACLSYDQSLEPTEEALTDQDLENICSIGKHISSRPPSDIISHEKALERCISLAMDWVNGEETTVPFASTTVGELVTKFERILSSDYCSVQPREVAPDIKQVPSHNTAYQPEMAATAGSGSLNGFHPGGAPYQANAHMQNGNLLHHMLNQQQSGQLPAETIGFMPHFNSPMTHQQQQHQAVQPSGGQAPPVSFSANQQPPGFELGDQQGKKQNNAPAKSQSPAAPYNPPDAQPYQGVLYAGISQPEAPATQTHSASAPQSFATLHDASPPVPIPPSQKANMPEPGASHVPPNGQPEKAGVRVEYSDPTPADPRNGPAGSHQSRGPQEHYRGRGHTRGRSGGSGGRGNDFVPRGGSGRRGGYNQGRGQKGGRRDFTPQPPHPTAAY